MTFEQADILADVFNLLVGQGKPTAFVDENYYTNKSVVRLTSGPGQHTYCHDASEFSEALKNWIDP